MAIDQQRLEPFVDKTSQLSISTYTVYLRTGRRYYKLKVQFKDEADMLYFVKTKPAWFLHRTGMFSAKDLKRCRQILHASCMVLNVIS